MTSGWQTSPLTHTRQLLLAGATTEQTWEKQGEAPRSSGPSVCTRVQRLHLPLPSPSKSSGHLSHILLGGGGHTHMPSGGVPAGHAPWLSTAPRSPMLRCGQHRPDSSRTETLSTTPAPGVSSAREHVAPARGQPDAGPLQSPVGDREQSRLGAATRTHRLLSGFQGGSTMSFPGQLIPAAAVAQPGNRRCRAGPSGPGDGL